MRLYFPVDLTGNLIMIEKLVMGGIWTGDLRHFMHWISVLSDALYTLLAWHSPHVGSSLVRGLCPRLTSGSIKFRPTRINVRCPSFRKPPYVNGQGQHFMTQLWRVISSLDIYDAILPRDQVAHVTSDAWLLTMRLLRWSTDMKRRRLNFIRTTLISVELVQFGISTDPINCPVESFRFFGRPVQMFGFAICLKTWRYFSVRGFPIW